MACMPSTRNDDKVHWSRIIFWNFADVMRSKSYFDYFLFARFSQTPPATGREDERHSIYDGSADSQSPTHSP